LGVVHPDVLLDGSVSRYYIFGIPIFTKYSPGLTSDQLLEWEAFDRLDPIGEWRADFRMAELATVISNIALHLNAGKKQVKPIEIDQFMPQWDVRAPKDPKKQSLADMRQALLDIYNNAQNTLKRNERIHSVHRKN